MSVRYITNKNVDGTSYGQGTTEKISFFGVTPIAQPSGAGQAALGTTAATSPGYGFTTATQANGIVTLVNEIRSVLVNLGLMKGSA